MDLDEADRADLGTVTAVADDAPDALEQVSILNQEQRRAYDIVSNHLDGVLAGRHPEQLLMQIQGEGGTGKTKVIETGIAASLIGGSTLHMLAKISRHGGRMSERTRRSLREFWSPVKYLIIDEISMISRDFFDTLARIISVARDGPGDAAFGGLNVIILLDSSRIGLHKREERARTIRAVPDRCYPATTDAYGRPCVDRLPTQTP